MRISDWSSDVCSSDLLCHLPLVESPERPHFRGNLSALDPRNMTQLAEAVARRRTFAIISHPDAGKTTLTEKLLLFGGAIQLAGAVKARGEQRRAHSDWMKVERERGISVASSVMTYDYAGKTFN